MSTEAVLSLTEALTDLAYGHPTPASAILSASGGVCLGGTRSDALKQLALATHILCDAGYRGEVKLWGKRNPSSKGPPPPDAPQQITQAECLQFRLIALGYDVLWSGKNHGDEYDDFFAAENGGVCIAEIRVDQADFSKLIARYRSTNTVVNPAANTAVVNPEKPGLPDGSLKRWWDSLSDEERDLPRDLLHERCVAAHPKNLIARRRIRELAPRRKPGPRPIVPNSAA